MIHVVKPNETLWQIANRYYTNLNSIVEVNGLPNPNQLVIGQALVIPLSTSLHIIKYGETLWQIAKQYGTTVDAIIRENHIEHANQIYPNARLTIPKTKRTIEVNAYTYQPEDEAVKSINEVGQLLTYVSPFAYIVTEDGSLNSVNDKDIIAAALSKQVVPMMSITNFTSTATGSNLAHTILSNKELSDKVLSNVLQVMEKKGYKGLNIDFENVVPDDRDLYTQFLQLAVNRLHPKGYFVSTAVAPKSSNDKDNPLAGAHDYEAHGRIADFVVLMTYEWGYRLGPPQAISPINQMRKVVEYALTVMPPEKIFLGFQIYARDWLLPHVKGQEAETFSPQEAVARALKYGATIQYDESTQSPFFRYFDEKGQEHEIWFEDARSAQAKFNLVKEFNLRGVSYWALGYPYPQNWALLEENFTIQKLKPS